MTVTKYQKFKMERIPRSGIKNAPYNPRKIDQYAKKKLKENLKKVGLIEPVIVNRKTMHIVGGHQRLAALDALEGNNEYELDVSMVDLTDKQEREQNIFLNNPTAQGQWDIIKLGELLNDLEIKIDIEGMGFDAIQLESMFDGSGININSALSINNEQFNSDMAAMLDVQDGSKKARDLDDDTADGDGFDEPIYADDDEASPEDELDAEAARIAHVKGVKEKLLKKGHDEADTEYLGVVVCRSRPEREAFMAFLGEDPEARYVSSEKFWAKVNTSPKKAAEAYEKATGHPLPSMMEEQDGKEEA